MFQLFVLGTAEISFTTISLYLFTSYYKLRTHRSLKTIRDRAGITGIYQTAQYKNQSESVKYLCHILILEHEMSYPAIKRN